MTRQRDRTAWVVALAAALAAAAPAGSDGRALAEGPKADGARAPARFDTPSAFRLGEDPAVKHSVPLADVRKGIRSAGDPRDRIPPIDEPRFETVKETKRYAGSDRVLALAHGGDARAYPIRVLTRHEVVNDVVGGEPVAIVYCPLCASGSGFHREVAGRVRRFGVSGYLYQSDVLLWDDGSESFWSQIEGKAVVGPETGAELRWLLVDSTTLDDFRARHPAGTVLVGPLGDEAYAKPPYAGWEARDEPGLFMDPAGADRRLHQKAIVSGIVVGGEALALPHERLAELGGRQTVELGGERVAITYDAEHDVVRAAIAGADNRTGDAIVVMRAYWFAWRAFHPETRVLGESPR